jgi:hypothetical protein
LNSLKITPTIFLLVTLAICAQAQTPTPTASASPSPTSSPTPTPVTPPKVTKVDGHLELDVVIVVEVEHLSEWAAKNDPTKLVPYLNGLAIRGNYPEEIHAATNHLHFHLQITPENRESWVDLLGEPPGTLRRVSFSVGPENQAHARSPENSNPTIWAEYRWPSGFF